MKTVL